MDHNDAPLVAVQEVENKPFNTFYSEPWLQNLSIFSRMVLTNFLKKIKTRKEALTLKLSRRESISSADEKWLDQEANTIDAERILHDLEAASDYERGLERLDEGGKATVKKLREWAGDLMKVAGNKWKCT